MVKGEEFMKEKIKRGKSEKDFVLYFNREKSKCRDVYF